MSLKTYWMMIGVGITMLNMVSIQLSLKLSLLAMNGTDRKDVLLLEVITKMEPIDSSGQEGQLS